MVERASGVTEVHPLGPLYHNEPTPLPEYSGAPELIRTYSLTQETAPAGAARFVKTVVHEVRRADGSIGYQVTNKMADGVSLLVVIEHEDDAYVVLCDQLRYPHVRPDPEHPGSEEGMSLELAAELGRIGIWSREIASGGVGAGETHESAARREAEEELGIVGVEEHQIKRIYPKQLLSSISVNNQPFNLMVAVIRPDQWQPETVRPDIEEGNVHVGAYRFDAVVKMIEDGTICEMSAVTAFYGLQRIPELRKHFYRYE